MFKKHSFILFTAACVILSACSHDNNPIAQVEEVSGLVSISLQTEAFVPLAKAAIEENVPHPEDLTVEIFKKTDIEDIRLFRDTYGKVKDNPIKLNCADYRMLAFYGDSLAVGEDLPYYEGIADFILDPENRQVEVSAVAKVANVRVSIQYGENIVNDYSEYYSKVRVVTPSGKKRSVEFYQDEFDKKAFMPAGNLYYELYAKVDGEWKYFPATEIKAVKGDDIIFKVDTKRLTGTQGITVTIAQTEMKEQSYEVPSSMLPQDAPEISTNMPQLLEMYQGDTPMEGLKMDLVVDGNIKECWLSINSPYLAALGVPEKIDLASENILPRVQAALESVGLRWMRSMAGRRFAYIDFSGISKFMGTTDCNPYNLFNADFSVEIIDQRHVPGQSSHNGVIKSKTYTFAQLIPAPSIQVKGFENGQIQVLEGSGVKAEGLVATVTAKGRFGHCYLDINSPYLQAMGIPSKVDLVNVDVATTNKLKSVGIVWPVDIAEITTAEIDFSGVVEYMDNSMYSSTNGQQFAKFSVSIENEVSDGVTANKASATVGSFAYKLPTIDVSTIQSHNVWAKWIKDFNATVTGGSLEDLKLQYSTDGADWNDISENITAQDAMISCSAMSAVPNTTYRIRAIYHNNPDLQKAFNQVKTEAAQQIPNADFETWTENTHKYTPYLSSSIYYYWHSPYNSSAKVWDLNAKRSMPSSSTGWSESNVKCFPCAGRSTDACEGSYSALIFVVNIGGTNTMSSAAGTDYIGELMIGNADGSGNLTKGTTPFSSRPSKFRVNYKYEANGSETFSAEVVLYNGSTVVASGSFTDGSQSSAWTYRDIPLTYAVQTTRPTAVHVSFKATTSSNPGVTTNSSIEYNGSEEPGLFGSQLRVDNLEFIYE